MAMADAGRARRVRRGTRSQLGGIPDILTSRALPQRQPSAMGEWQLERVACSALLEQSRKASCMSTCLIRAFTAAELPLDGVSLQNVRLPISPRRQFQITLYPNAILIKDPKSIKRLWHIQCRGLQKKPKRLVSRGLFTGM